MTAEAAAALLGVEPNEVNPFEEPDTFNGGRLLAGHLSRRSDHRYGAMVIHLVGGKDVEPQRVFATPKLHYPFGRTEEEGRQYHWPADVRRVEVYEKLDGTNVCAYSYADASGQRFVTFKTRLTPVLRGSKWGDFAALWREVMRAHPELRAPEPVLSGRFTFSYELYGHRNVHTVVYEEPLAARLLFAVDQERAAECGWVVCPHATGGALQLEPLHVLRSGEALTSFYEQCRGEAEAKNAAVDGERIEGTEGFVFYVQAGERWLQFKAKPESVEALHWAGDSLPRSVILPTAWNALESCEGELTADYVSELLLEEFSELQVTRSRVRVEQAVEIVAVRLRWRERVHREYAGTGLDWGRDGKRAVMRALSACFPREKMKEVYNGLRELGVARDD